MTLSDFWADILVILPLAFLMTWACILLLVDAFLPHQKKAWTAGLSALGLLISLAIVVWQFLGATGPLSVWLQDGFSLFLQSIFLISGLLALPKIT
jgi:NADH:ubiquinone oxidoreductase subunit 2 (subunit N)